MLLALYCIPWSLIMYRFQPRFRFVLPLIAFLCVVGQVIAQQGHPVPRNMAIRWELDYEPGDLRLHVDRTDGRAYWFFTYKITNRTRKARVWAPTFVLFTDAGEILESGEGVPRRVTFELLKLLGNDLMENQTQIIGDLLEGPTMAKDGLVVWPARNTRVNQLKMFVGGISGETARVTNPITGERTILRKTWEQNYLIPGDALPRGHEPLQKKGDSRWIFR